MTQEQYNVICKILQNGAPALANEFIASINALLEENASLKATTAQKDCDEQRMEEK